MKKKKEGVKVCRFCSKTINSNEKYVLLGTYKSKKPLDKNYYHFDCFRAWFNNKVHEKAIKEAQTFAGKIFSIFGDLTKNISILSLGNQLHSIFLGNEDLDEELDEDLDEELDEDLDEELDEDLEDYIEKGVESLVKEIERKNGKPKRKRRGKTKRR